MSETVQGLLQRARKGGYYIRPADKPAREVSVPPAMVSRFGLARGAQIEGQARAGQRGLELVMLDSVCGMSPDAFKARTRFADLTPIDPDERFQLGESSDVSARIVDLVAPIGKGTRGLIVAPPKAGKTMLLEKLAGAIHQADPRTRIVAMLIDERPEEVTYFRRMVQAEVFASSNDQTVQQHIELAELMLDHIRVELECGRDVVVLVDSFTRLVRAFNLRGTDSHRTLSGGLDAGAAELPRRLFGLARNVENGGSVTILASILVDTGSRMDQVIFEEFKGTGNSEIVLDRSLAEARIFPAVNVLASGTRKDERLYTPDEHRRMVALRRILLDYKPKEAMTFMLRLMEKYPTNRDLLARVPVNGDV